MPAPPRPTPADTCRRRGKPDRADQTASAAAAPTLKAGTPPDDLWLRALVLAPDLQNYLTATVLGQSDMRELLAADGEAGRSCDHGLRQRPQSRPRYRSLHRRRDGCSFRRRCSRKKQTAASSRIAGSPNESCPRSSRAFVFGARQDVDGRAEASEANAVLPRRLTPGHDDHVSQKIKSIPTRACRSRAPPRNSMRSSLCPACAGAPRRAWP